MNDACRRFVSECLARLPGLNAVVELGSYDVNGTVRDLFPGREYVGVDLRPGPGVDVVAAAREWRPARPVDLVLCLNALEHEREPWEIIRNAREMLEAHGALIVVAAAPGFPPHSVHGGALGEGEYYGAVTVAQLEEWLAGFASWEVVERENLVMGLAMASGKVPEAASPRHSGQWCICAVCQRALWVEDGPICPDCLAKRAPEGDAGATNVVDRRTPKRERKARAEAE